MCIRDRTRIDMGFVIEAVATYAAYIYAVCGLVALYHIYKAVSYTHLTLPTSDLV